MATYSNYVTITGISEPSNKKLNNRTKQTLIYLVVLLSLFRICVNAKNFAIACGVDFLLPLLSVSEMDHQKFFCENFTIRYPGTDRSRSGLLPWLHWQIFRRWYVYCYSRRMWPMIRHVLQEKISNASIKWAWVCYQYFSRFSMLFIV